VRGGERLAGTQPLGADQAHRQVPVAEPEPVWPPGPLERLHHLPGVVAQPPAALVDLVGEPVGHEIGVGGDVDPVHLDVVARVGDHGQLFADVQQAARELRSARASRQQHHRIH
jgi:hypothetical protein